MSKIEDRTQFEDALAYLAHTGVRFYQGWYSYKNQRPSSKVFLHKGTVRDAGERWTAHCTRMNYRAHGCFAFVVDLDAQEKLRNDFEDDIK